MRGKNSNKEENVTKLEQSHKQTIEELNTAHANALKDEQTRLFHALHEKEEIAKNMKPIYQI